MPHVTIFNPHDMDEFVLTSADAGSLLSVV